MRDHSSDYSQPPPPYQYSYASSSQLSSSSQPNPQRPINNDAGFKNYGTIYYNVRISPSSSGPYNPTLSPRKKLSEGAINHGLWVVLLAFFIVIGSLLVIGTIANDHCSIPVHDPTPHPIDNSTCPTPTLPACPSCPAPEHKQCTMPPIPSMPWPGNTYVITPRNSPSSSLVAKWNWFGLNHWASITGRNDRNSATQWTLHETEDGWFAFQNVKTGRWLGNKGGEFTAQATHAYTQEGIQLRMHPEGSWLMMTRTYNSGLRVVTEQLLLVGMAEINRGMWDFWDVEEMKQKGTEVYQENWEDEEDIWIGEQKDEEPEEKTVD